MAGLEYWFDGKKITGASDDEGKKTLIKDEFKSMMLNGSTLTDQGNDVFDAIWGNTNLAVNLFGNRLEPAAKLYFTNTLVNDLSSNFYNFIKVK